MILALVSACSLLLHRLQLGRAARREQPEEPENGFWIACALSAGCLAVLALFTLERAQPIWDSLVYHRMANGHLLDGRYEPFCRRILVPGLAALLPLETHDAFELLNFVCLGLTGLVLHRFLSRSGLPQAAARAGIALFLGSAFVKFVIWYRFGIDQAAVLAIALVAMALEERRLVLAAGLAALFVTGKESILLLAPYTLAALPARGPGWGGRLRRGARVLALWGPAIAVYVGLVRAIPSDQGTGFLETVRFWAGERFGALKPALEIPLALPKTFGAIPLLLLLRWRATAAELRRDLPGTAVIAAYLLLGIFAASDYERVYFLAFPFVLRLFLRVLCSAPPSATQVAALVVAQLGLLDVLARPDFQRLGDWFLVNATWPSTLGFAAKVGLGLAALWALGLGRGRASAASESTSPASDPR